MLVGGDRQIREVIRKGATLLHLPRNVAGTNFLDEHEIVAGRFESWHERRVKGDPPRLMPEHRAAKMAIRAG